MDPEDKEETNLSDEVGQNSTEFGKIIDTLHSKQKLPSLRTYQGDMAEFIKEKNESVISIAVKEKEKKERIEKEEEKFGPIVKSEKEGGFKKNVTIVFLSLVLIAGGVAVSFYIFNALKEEPVSEVVVEEKIIPYNNLITLANVTSGSLGSEIAKLSPPNGESILKVSDTNGFLFQTAKNFFNFLEISLPATLERTLKDEYAVGIISQNSQTSYFLVITISDFGRAFSGMLDWENSMAEGLSFLNPEENSFISSNFVPPVSVATSTATSTAVSTTTATTTKTTTATSSVLSVKIPMKPDIFSWKDMIVKNKDTRALVNEKRQAKIAYTFLDKNTILITNNLSAVGDIYAIYASRSIVR